MEVVLAEWSRDFYRTAVEFSSLSLKGNRRSADSRYLEAESYFNAVGNSREVIAPECKRGRALIIRTKKAIPGDCRSYDQVLPKLTLAANQFSCD